MPRLLTGEALGGSVAVLVSAGRLHTVAVTIEGALWVWGGGEYGQLGLGHKYDRLAPTLVGTEGYLGVCKCSRWPVSAWRITLWP